jgi:hypothetical protein
MAYFSTDIDYRTVCGQFENEFARFEYRANTRPDLSDMPHEIAMSDGSFRFAKVLKTVVYVAVDEDENGPIVEKWNIKAVWARRARGANFNCCAINGMLPDDIDDSAF